MSPTVLPTLAQVLDREGVGYDVIPHSRTESALEEAAAIGVRTGEVAKTLVVKTPDGYARAVLPASERIDMRKLREVLDGGKEIRLATEDELQRDYPEFELGAVPPFGGRTDTVVVDSRLAGRESVVLEAGSHELSLRVETKGLLALAKARVADVSLD